MFDHKSQGIPVTVGFHAQQLLTIAAGVVVLVVAFMFSLLALGVVLVVGVLIFAYLKWKTRNLPRDLRDLHERMQEQAARQNTNEIPVFH